MIWNICCDCSSSELPFSWVFVAPKCLFGLFIFSSAFPFLVCRVSGAACDWTVGGCQENQPQQRWARVSQGSAYISCDCFYVLDTLLPCLFLNDTFCFNVVLQSNFDSNSTKLFNQALFWHRSINCIIFLYLVAKYYLCTVSHGKCNLLWSHFYVLHFWNSQVFHSPGSRCAPFTVCPLGQQIAVNNSI